MSKHHKNKHEGATTSDSDREEIENTSMSQEGNEVADHQETMIEQLDKQVNVLKDQVMRERAENDNLRKRQQRELQNAHKFASEKLIKDLLPVLDSLTLGIDAAKSNGDAPDAIASFIEGSEMTLKLLNETLAKHGVEEINPEGEKFNPELHEAVTALPNNEVAPNTVINVAQKGYTLNGRVIRAAQVVIARAG